MNLLNKSLAVLSIFLRFEEKKVIKIFIALALINIYIYIYIYIKFHKDLKFV